MRITSSYIRTKLRRRFIDFLIVLLFIQSFVFFGFRHLEFGEAILSHNEYNGTVLGEDQWFDGFTGWYVEFSGDAYDGIDPRDVIISNPEFFPDLLKPENLGKKIIYLVRTRNMVLAIYAVRSEIFYILDLKTDFYVKLFLNSFLLLIFILTITFLVYTNRKKFQIIEKFMN